MITEKDIEQFKNRVANVCLLLQIDFLNQDDTITTEYYTTFDVPVVFKEYNTTFKPLPFNVEAFEYSAGLSVDNITLVISNVDLKQTAFQLNKDQRGQEVVLGMAILDSEGNVLGVFEIFSGKISSVEINNKEARFTIKHELLWWNNITLRLHTYDLFPNQKDLKPSNMLKWGS